MVGGLITPSAIMGNYTPNYETRRYLINASLIVTGDNQRHESRSLKPHIQTLHALLLCLALPCARRHHDDRPVRRDQAPPPSVPTGRWVRLRPLHAHTIRGGRGAKPKTTDCNVPRSPRRRVLSCMGVSFTTLPIAQVVIPELRADFYLSHPECTDALKSADCSVSPECPRFPSDRAGCQQRCPAEAYRCQSDSFDYGWGMMLGTSCFCALLPAFLSLLSFKRINQLFPPIVVGPTIMLIGIALIDAGIGYWGGGALYCFTPNPA